MKDSLDRIDFATRRKGGVDSRIVIVCEYSKSGQIVARTANGVRQTYEYDKKGQLLAVKDSDGNAVERYAYDKAGNMLKKQILRSGRAGAPRTPQSDDYITTTFTFDDANQLVSSTTDGVTTRYTYDAAGRLVREGNKRYTYGYLDKVMSVTDGDTTRTFTYHADGQLASATVGSALRADRGATPLSETETFLWDGLALIQRGDEQFVNEPHIGGGNPVASSKGTSYFNDALGTTVGSKSNGKYSAAALTAFGEDLTVHSPTPTQNSNFFTGKPFVEGLGHAFLMRNYRAGLAKWQTADPMGYPDGWNQLAYCGNGVTGAVDLWGCAEWRLVESWDTGLIASKWKEVSRTAPDDDEIREKLFRYGEFGWIRPRLVEGTPEQQGDWESSGVQYHYLDKYFWWDLKLKAVYQRVDTLQCELTTKELAADSSLWDALSSLGCTAAARVPGPFGAMVGLALDFKSIEDDLNELSRCIDEYGSDTVWTIDFGQIIYNMTYSRETGALYVYE